MLLANPGLFSTSSGPEYHPVQQLPLSALMGPSPDTLLPTKAFLWSLVFEDPEMRDGDDNPARREMANEEAPEQPS